MRAVRGAPPGVEIVDVDEPDEPGELIEIRSASICASDFGYLQYGARNILGHELAGLTQDGTPVAIEAIFGCDGCEQCDSGHRNLCHTTSQTALGMMVDGGMRKYFRAPRTALVPLPAGLPVESGCLVEPTAVAWHCCDLAGVTAGSRVAIVGGGAIGLMAIAAAQALGASEVAIEARYPHQLELAERLGAVTSTSGLYDVVIEAAGSESSLHRCAQLVRPLGSMGILGVHGPDVAWPGHALFMKEATAVPSLGYCTHGDGSSDFGQAAQLLADHPDLADCLVTHRFPIEDGVEAFRVAGDRKAGAVRVIIEP